MKPFLIGKINIHNLYGLYFMIILRLGCVNIAFSVYELSAVKFSMSLSLTLRGLFQITLVIDAFTTKQLKEKNNRSCVTINCSMKTVRNASLCVHRCGPGGSIARLSRSEPGFDPRSGRFLGKVFSGVFLHL